MFHRSSKPAEPVQRKPKVVSIPVHFIGSETARSASALKIQKIFRGFLVRKSVKKINAIRQEAEEIEKRISERDVVELIRRESKERLRLNETLMALLFKLDSVRGVDCGVRDLRKGVIRKVIALQERVDAIAAGDRALEIKDSVERQTLETEGSDDSANQSPAVEVEDPYDKEGAGVVSNRDFSSKAGDESGEVHCSDEAEAMSETTDDQKMDIDLVDASPGSEITLSVENFVGSDSFTDQTPSGVEEPDDNEEADVLKSSDSLGKTVGESGELHYPEQTETTAEIEDNERMDVAEVGVGSEAKEDEEGCVVKQVVVDSHVSNGIGEQKDQKLLERVMEEHEKMMSLMTQLYEKNEVQTQMLSSLTRRVELLERALVCERLRKKKKRHAVGTMDCLESNPEQKKCEKR